MAPLVGDAAGVADVLVARATPPGAGALAIVRLSGPPGRALAIARGVAPRLPEDAEPRRTFLSPFLAADGEPVDEGLVIFFASPASATGEEVVELHAHGSPAIVEALLESAVSRGARRARPGEFTRRALANGKVDLARAEGIGRLAAALDRGEARRALGLVRGELSRRVEALREELFSALVELEARLDFAEDVGREGEEAVLEGLARTAARLRALGADVGRGRGVEEVPSVVILGVPNAGKSTLFNALVGEDRALVTEIPGTTRDAVSEIVEIEGSRVRIVDTAGLRETADPLERLGGAAALRAAAAADLVLLAREEGGGAPDEALLPAGAERVRLLTKGDLGGAAREGELVVSARTGSGIDLLRREIAARLLLDAKAGTLSALPRQREALARASAALDAVGGVLAGEVAAAAVREALGALGEITGETATEELLDRVFSTFWPL